MLTDCRIALKNVPITPGSEAIENGKGRKRQQKFNGDVGNLEIKKEHK